MTLRIPCAIGHGGCVAASLTQSAYTAETIGERTLGRVGKPLPLPTLTLRRAWLTRKQKRK